MGFFQNIVATGNGQPPESPFYYSDKLCLMGQKVNYSLRKRKQSVAFG